MKNKFSPVNAIKNEINKGNLISMGLVMASDYQPGNNGMTGNTKIIGGKTFFTNKKQPNAADYNTWCATVSLGKYIKRNIKNDNLLGSHQMIVIGYIDNPKDRSEGVLILRNSWGADCGDNGNNYVTYRYAYYLCDELISISVGQDGVVGLDTGYL